MKRLVLIAAVVTSAFGVKEAKAQWAWVMPGYVYVDALTVVGSTVVVGCYDGGGVFLATDTGSTWASVNTGLPPKPTVSAFAVLGLNLFACVNYNIYRSTNNATSWVAASNGLPTYGGVWALAVSGTNIFAGTYDYKVYRSTDSGASWTQASSGLPTDTNRSSPIISALTASGTNLFAGTAFDGVFLSTNSGASWNAVNNGLTEQRVNALAAIGTDIFVGTIDSGVYHSTNNGESWTSANNGVEHLGGFTVFTFGVSGKNLFFGGNGGIAFSSDKGASWASANDALLSGFYGVNSVAVTGEYVFAGCGGDGVYRRALSDFNNSAVSPTASVENSLTTYPNPFTQSTTITLTAPESGVAEVSVVNLLGTEVARIFSGEISAGEHTFTWNATGLPDGMYECIMRMNGQVQRVPMVHTSSAMPSH